MWLAYVGTLGHSCDLTTVFEAISLLRKNEKNLNLRFIIMGDGPSKCDIAINPIAHGAAQSIINKHAAYVAAGLPIVSTQKSDEFSKLVEQYMMGFNCINGDAVDMAKKIKRLIDKKDLRIEMGKNARLCAEELFDRKKTYLQVVEIIERGVTC